MASRRTTNQPDPETAADGSDPQAAGGGDTTAAESTATGARPRRQSSPKRSGAAVRGRRTGGNETTRLVEALLKSRGSRGASQQDLELAVRWAEGVRAEAAAVEAEASDLRKLGPRGSKPGGATGAAATRQKQQRQERQRELDERRQRLAMNQALLDGIGGGRVSLDVRDGQLLFLHGEYAASHAAAEEAADGGEP